MFPCAKDAFDFNGNSTIKLAKLVLERKLSWVMTSCLDLQHRSHSLNMQKMAHISKWKMCKKLKTLKHIHH